MRARWSRVARGRPDRPDEGRGSRVRLFLGLLGSLAILALIAWWTSQFGLADQRYALADLREDPLYLRGPGPRIVLGIAVSLVIALLAWLNRRAAPGDDDTLPWRWWWLLVAGWGGYAAGSLLAIAIGGPVEHPATMQVAFGAPIGRSVELAAVCRSAPNAATKVVSVEPVGAGLRLALRDPVTGEARPYPAPDGVAIDALTGGGPDLVIPGLAGRPPVQEIEVGMGSIRLRERSFLASYLYRETASAFTDGGGTVSGTGSRARTSLQAVNDLIANDPWPEALELTISWHCDLARVFVPPPPSPSTVPSTPSAIATPFLTAASVSTTRRQVPVEIRLATRAAQASVEIAGASVEDVETLSTAGGATADHESQLLRVTSARPGQVSEATFRVTLAVLDATTRLGLNVARSGEGDVAVTVLNVLGPEPVPVFANMGVSADRPGWPIELDPALLIAPLSVEVVGR